MAGALTLGVTALPLAATEIIKGNNLDNLNLFTSWASDAVPGAADIAIWNNTVTNANTVLLGGNLAFGGIRLTNPAGAVTIDAGNILTLLKSGIDMSAATQDLTINATVALGDPTNGSYAQTWNVAAGRTLTVGAIPVRNNGANNIGVGGVVKVTGAGTARIGAAALGVIADGGGNPFVTLNGDDWAATDATGTVVAATYVNDVFTGGTNVNIVTAGAYAIAAAATASLRFANDGGPVTVTSNNSTNTLRGILMTSTAQSVTITGGFIRPNRTSTAGATFSFIQNSLLGDLTISSNIPNASGSPGTPVSISKSGVGKMILNGPNGWTGQTFIHEGTLQLGDGGTGGTIASTANIINNANFIVNHSDGIALSNVISGTGNLTQAGTGTLTLSGASTYTGATNLNAGTLAFNLATSLGNGGVINFNGGALRFGNGNTTDISIRTINLGAAGGAIDTNGNAVSFASGIGNGGSGSLTKTGVGVLTLSGVNTYTGVTNINGGTLKINGSVAGAGNVASGAIVSGTGTINGLLTVNTGGIVAPGNSVGTLSTSALTLSTGSILNFEFNLTPANDRVNVTTSGGLTINGGGFNLYQEGTTNAFSTNGTYSLIGYSGAIGGAGTTVLSVLNPQPGKSYLFGSTGSNVTLSIATSGVISEWQVDANGSWNTAGNWLGGTVPNGLGATANFSATLTSTRTVTLDGNKTLGSITFNPGTNGYIVAEGAGGSLLHLNNDLGQANIIASSGSNIISAGVSLDSAVTVAAINTGASLALSGAVSGVSALTKSGLGTLTLNGTNSYSGGTVVSAGTLIFNSLSALGSGTTLGLGAAASNGILKYASGNTGDVSGLTITLNEGGGTIDTNGNDITFANAIGNGGVGGLTKAGAGKLSLAAANTYTGGSTITGGTLNILSDTSLGADSGAPSTNLTFDPGAGNTAILQAGAAALILSANRSIVMNSGTAIFDTNGNDFTVGGAISGTGDLRKIGGGTLILNGVNSGTGSTILDEGTVAVANRGSLPTGSITFNGSTGITVGNVAAAFGNLVVNGTNFISKSGNSNILGIGATTGAGVLTVSSNFVSDLTGDLTNFTGTLVLNGNGVGGGTTRFFGSAGGANVTFDVRDFLSVRGTANTITLGTLLGTGQINGSGGGATQAVTFVIGGKTVGGTPVDGNFTGIIGDGAAPVSLNKVGTSKLTLGGVNTYTGATTVNAGTLEIAANGSIATSSQLTVTATGTLSGTGTTGAVTINGTIAPGGNVIGTIHTGAFSLGDTGTLSAQLSNAGAVPVNDQVAVTIGLVSLFTGANLQLTLDGAFSDQIGAIYYLVDNQGVDAVSGTFTRLDGVETNLEEGSTFLFNSREFKITYQADFASSSFNGGNDVALMMTAVPEPGTIALFFAGCGLLAFVLRRQSGNS